MATKVILILGAGPNVGQSTAKLFATKGYKVALASRKADDAQDTPDRIHIRADFTKTDSIVEAFAKTKAALGIPSVVLFNSYAGKANPPDDPLSVPLVEFEENLVHNTTSPYVAAQQAIAGFAQLPDSASKTLLYTGNTLNITAAVITALLSNGVGKSATAYIIKASAKAYAGRGFKFYYVDERKANGDPVYDAINGDAHAAHFFKLAEGTEQGPWLQTFVKSAGYKNFEAA